MEKEILKELPACPVETTLTLISDKWKVLILRDLMPGTKRFGELKKSIGHVTQKVLTAQLRDMEAKGLLTRKVYAEVPPRVEYTLDRDRLQPKPFSIPWSSWGTHYNGKKPRQWRMTMRPMKPDPGIRVQAVRIPTVKWRHVRAPALAARRAEKTPQAFCGCTAADTSQG